MQAYLIENQQIQIRLIGRIKEAARKGSSTPAEG